MPTLEELTTELEPHVLAGLTGAELDRGRALLARLLPYWLDEARAGGNLAPQVLTILRSDLDRDLAPLAPGDRLVLLESDVLDRELRALSNEAFALGKQIIDGAAADDEARRHGQALLSSLEPYSPKIDAITLEPRRVVLRRQLEDAMLEALYAVRRKAMSPRLSRYAQDHARP